MLRCYHFPVDLSGKIKVPDGLHNTDAFVPDSLDLTAASRAYLMEPHWNPSIERQALARVYRMGQRRPVTTIRYVMRNSFEDVGHMQHICSRKTYTDVWQHVLDVQHRKQRLADLLLNPKGSLSNLDGKERLEVRLATSFMQGLRLTEA